MMIFAPNARDRRREAAEDDPSHIPFMTAFIPPENETRQTLFPPGSNTDYIGVPHSRFIRKDHLHDILIYTDGTCLGNGQEEQVVPSIFDLPERLYSEKRTALNRFG